MHARTILSTSLVTTLAGTALVLAAPGAQARPSYEFIDRAAFDGAPTVTEAGYTMSAATRGELGYPGLVCDLLLDLAGAALLAADQPTAMRSTERATSRRRVSSSSPAEAPPDSILGSYSRDGGPARRYLSVDRPLFSARQHGR